MSNAAQTSLFDNNMLDPELPGSMFVVEDTTQGGAHRFMMFMFIGAKSNASYSLTRSPCLVAANHTITLNQSYSVNLYREYRNVMKIVNDFRIDPAESTTE